MKHRTLKHWQDCRESSSSVDPPQFETCLSVYLSKVGILNKTSELSVDENTAPKFLVDGLFDFTESDEEIDWMEYISENIQLLDSFLVKCDFKREYCELLEIVKDVKVDEYLCYLLENHKNGCIYDSFSVCSILGSIIERILVSVIVNHFKIKLEENPTLSSVVEDPSIEKFLGEKFKNFIVATVGSSLGLNIRNIIFHGFISCDKEFSKVCTSLLFLIVMTILSKVQKAKVKIDWYWKDISKERIFFPEMKLKCEDVLDLCRRSYFVIEDRKNIVSHAIKNYFQGKYYEFMVLLVPQIEHCIRRIFIVCNKKEERYFFAQRKELFTTLDILLAFSQKDRGEKNEKNLIYEELGETTYQCLMDIFLRESGLRLRDLYAHFQQPPFSVLDLEFPSILFKILVNVMAKFVPRDETHLLPKQVLFWRDYFESEYIPRFNPITTFLDDFQKTVHLLNKFEKLCTSNEEKFNNIKEVGEYECRWDMKTFFYSKKKSPSPKGNFYKVDDFVLILNETIDNEPKCEYFWEESDPFEIVKIFRKENSGHLEDLKVSIDHRREMMNNVGMCCKIVYDIRELVGLIIEKEEELQVMIEKRKARTKHRKVFGTIRELKIVFHRVMVSLLMFIHVRIKDDIRKYENLVENHKYYSKLFGIGSQKILSLAKEGKFGLAIYEFMFGLKIIKK